ncbi:TPA: hypothetical protein ACX6Q6_003561 [Photobacterium damselae]
MLALLLNPTVLHLLAKLGLVLLKAGAKSTKNTLDDEIVAAVDEAVNG